LPEVQEPERLVTVGGKRRIRADEPDREQEPPARRDPAARRRGREEERDGEAARDVDEERSVRPTGAEPPGERVADDEPRYRSRGAAAGDEQDGRPAPHCAAHYQRRSVSCSAGLRLPARRERRAGRRRAAGTT